MKLLSSGNPKTLKGQKKGYLTYILHLAPGTLSGYNVCPQASSGCLAGCLNTAGRGRFDKIQSARIRKTRLFFENRAEFMTTLVSDIRSAIREADRKGFVPVIRLNGTSDIRWETVRVDASYTERRVTTIYNANNIMEAFPEIQFYDYTKLSNRRNVPKNYHLTFSRSESNDTSINSKVGEAFANGMNVAVVFNTKKNDGLPVRFRSLPVVDGDDTDLRFLESGPVFVGLRPKGQAKKDVSGFVVNV